MKHRLRALIGQVLSLGALQWLLMLVGGAFVLGCNPATPEDIAEYTESITVVAPRCGAGPRGDYCSGNPNVMNGATNTLYACQPNSNATNPRLCSGGCAVMPAGQNDLCLRSFVASGDVLLVAQSGNFDAQGRLLFSSTGALRGGNALPRATPVYAENRSSLRVGSVAGVRCAVAARGDYCGSSTTVVNGSPNTLYRCDGGAASNARVCQGACTVRPPGQNDTCTQAVDTVQITVAQQQCAGFAQQASGAPLTSNWRRGTRVVDACPPVGTIVATFDSAGKYSVGNHSAILLGCTATSLVLFDSNWIDTVGTNYLRHVGRHTLSTSGSGLANAANYYVVLAP